jgi:hypothetical protein
MSFELPQKLDHFEIGLDHAGFVERGIQCGQTMEKGCFGGGHEPDMGKARASASRNVEAGPDTVIQCVVSPGLGGASSSSATFFRSSPNDRRTSGLTLLRNTTSPSGVTAITR